jgi:hypothetical protein
MHRVLPDGRVVIPQVDLRALESRDPGRIVDTSLLGRSARVILLDRPYQLGLRVEGEESETFYLNRIRVRELTGWPPHVAGGGTRSLIDSKLAGVRFRRADATGSEGIELDLDDRGALYSARMSGTPLPLLESALATLRQPGVLGTRLIDVQELRLIGA